jgi:non-heme chloroperoxidase
VENRILLLLVPVVFSMGTSRAQNTAAYPPPKQQFVPVEKDVKLEALDWGGTGRPLVFLAGMGNDAHTYDRFAPQFTAKYRVYGITRRGLWRIQQADSHQHQLHSRPSWR